MGLSVLNCGTNQKIRLINELNTVPRNCQSNLACSEQKTRPYFSTSSSTGQKKWSREATQLLVVRVKLLLYSDYLVEPIYDFFQLLWLNRAKLFPDPLYRQGTNLADFYPGCFL